MNRLNKITIRLNDIENRTIREKAKLNQITISEYIRTVVLNKPLESNPEFNGDTTTSPLNQ